LKGRRDKLRLTHVKLRDSMPMFEGWCARESFHSAPQGAEYTGAHLKCLYTRATTSLVQVRLVGKSPGTGML